MRVLAKPAVFYVTHFTALDAVDLVPSARTVSQYAQLWACAQGRQRLDAAMLALAPHLAPAARTAASSPLGLILEDEGACGAHAALLSVCKQLAIDDNSAQFVLCAAIPCDNRLANALPGRVHTVAYPEASAGAARLAEACSAAERPRGGVDRASTYVIIDNVSLACMYEGCAGALALLQALKRRAATTAVLAVAYAGHLEVQDREQLRHVASCEMLIRKASALQSDVMLKSMGHLVAVEVVVSALRNSGRVKIESALYALRGDGELVLQRAPAHVAITAQRLAASSIPDPETAQRAARRVDEEHAALQARYEKDMSGFMKLTLSAQEREQRDNVVLPWEHQGNSDARQADDFRAYLPPAAGGHGKGGGQDGLGHIMYVRDSDNSADSDEDPDDDLDI